MKLPATISLWERLEDEPENYPTTRTDQQEFLRWCAMRRAAKNFRDRPDGIVYHQIALGLLDEHHVREALTPEEYVEYRRTKDYPKAVKDSKGKWYASRQCMKDAKETQRSAKLLQEAYEQDECHS